MKYCTNCGFSAPAKNSFCTNCGAGFAEPQVQVNFTEDTYAGVSPKARKTRKHGSQRAKIALLFVCVALVLSAGLFFFLGFNRSPTARVMTIFRTDGHDVRLSSGTGSMIDARAGTRLHVGYTVSTGFDSFCYINLDADSLVKMDLLSRITIEQATERLLTINVESGQILIDVQELSPGSELRAIIGNTAIGVRGTLFVAGHYDGGEAIVIMLEGVAEIGEAMLTPGYVKRVFDEELYTAERIQVLELDDFAVQAILDNYERVLAAGAITQEEFDWLYRQRNRLDYITIQGVQFSTELTALELNSSAGIRTHELTNEDIEPLRHMVNLRRLVIWGAPLLNDLSPIAELTNLSNLTVRNSGVSDLTPLAGLTNLSRLILTSNRISDLTPLAHIAGIDAPHTRLTLDLSFNQISDLSPLAGLTRLHTLRLDHNQIVDITPLAGLYNLHELSVEYNQINSIAPLAGLTDIQYLFLGNNNISDISPLRGFVNIQQGLRGNAGLHLHNNPITDRSPVDHLGFGYVWFGLP